MKDRIRKIRIDQHLTQTAFGARIGVKGNTITNYESGLRTPTDAVVLAICREFYVNEKWLRCGEGEPYIEKTLEEDLAAFMGRLLTGSESFKKRLITALSKLSEDEWALLERIISESSKK